VKRSRYTQVRQRFDSARALVDDRELRRWTIRSYAAYA
jgi:hypothetical protein